jgi:hypothetical protein
MSAVNAVLNRDRDEVRVPTPHGGALLAYLTQRGLRGSLRTDRAGDLIVLAGEPDMGRVASILSDWKRRAAQTAAANEGAPQAV